MQLGPATGCAATDRRPLRIAVVSYALPRPGYKRGGIERVAHDLAHGLACRGHHVVVFSHDPAPPGASYDVAELPWRAFVSTWAGRRITMGYLGNLLSALPPFGDAEVILAHGDSLLLPLRGRPVVRVMHGTALEEARTATSARTPHPAGRRVRPRSADRADAAALRRRQREHAPRQPFRQAGDPERRRSSRSSDPTATARAPVPTLLFVGALGGRKRGRWLVRQFGDHVRRAHPECRAPHGRASAGEPRRGRRVPHGGERCRARRPLQACVGLRLPVHVRGFRPAVRRGARVRHAGRRHAEPWQPRGARGGGGVLVDRLAVRPHAAAICCSTDARRNEMSGCRQHAAPSSSRWIAPSTHMNPCCGPW